MKTMHVGMVAVTLLSGAIPLALTHCSSSNATTATDGGHTGNSGSGSGGSGGGESSGGGDEADSGIASGSSSGSAPSGDGGGAGPTGEGGVGSADGGSSSGAMTVTCQAPDGGAACDPGVVPCGSTTCDTSQTSCCRATGDAGTDTCVGPNGACTGSLVRCNETSDCAAGLVCCDNYGATSCAASCGAYSYQILSQRHRVRSPGRRGSRVEEVHLADVRGTHPGWRPLDARRHPGGLRRAVVWGHGNAIDLGTDLRLHCEVAPKARHIEARARPTARAIAPGRRSGATP